MSKITYKEAVLKVTYKYNLVTKKSLLNFSTTLKPI